jgi:ABC-2 type transport system permease protein
MIPPQSDVVAPHDFISPEDEAWVFGRMRYRILTTLLRQMLSQSRFRVALVVVLTGSLWIGMFTMFHIGFEELKSAIAQPEMHARMIGAVFGAFFAALMFMLIFSSGIILYSSLFCSREAAFLLTTPARVERVFLHKFQEALILSSWGFVLLGSPILLAYGVVMEAPWYYYGMLLPYLLAFIYIPVAFGAMICLTVVRRIPDSRLTVLILGGVMLVLGVVWIVWLLLSDPKGDLLTSTWFRELLNRMQFSERRLLPSWWLSSGLLSAAEGTWSESILFLTLLVSNALLFRQLALWMASRMYRAAYSGLSGKALWRRRPRPIRFDRLLAGGLRFLPVPMRVMTVKDLRLFRRDPLQWSQCFIFFALLALYFFNIHRFTYHGDYIGWMNMVSFLNLAVVGLLLSTFTTRFVFPMISLESRRFWVLGLLPVRRETILWGKFLFAAGGSIIPVCSLVFLSDAMLSVSTAVIVSHQMTCLVLCLGLSGIAVGLGARFPNLREQSPSRIAAGFGGTLNLVISTLYILLVVLMTALPTHFSLAAQYALAAGSSVAPIETQPALRWWLTVWLAGGTVGSFLLGAVATLAPMRIGLKAFRHTEF